MLSQRGKPLLVHDGHTFGIQYVRKDKKYWQCNLSRKFNCKARVTTTDTGEIIVTNNEHCHTEIRQHLRKDYQRNKVMMNALLNLSTMQRHNVHSLNNLSNLKCLPRMFAAATQGGMHHDESDILDLAKGAATPLHADFETATPHDLSSTAFQQQQQQHHHQQQRQQQQQNPADNDHMVPDEDDDEPLDCGVHDMVKRATALNENSTQPERESEHLDSIDAWPCNNEMPTHHGQ